MTSYSYSSDDTGRSFTFASEDAYERANEWYNNTSKADVLAFCSAHGVDLTEATDDPYYRTGVKLVDDWADVAMELYAKVHEPAH